MNNKIRMTVFTPTYNRQKLLHRGFEAMKRQTCKNFIWTIVDDGSTDQTEEVVHEWQQEDLPFELRYIKKENGGLHTAYNTAIADCDTELLMCVDSDDYLPDDAVERILCFWSENGSQKYAGIVGLDYDLQGRVIGDPLPDQKSVNLIDLLVGKYPLINGDRKNVVRTALYKKVAPMRVFPGEKNFNPHYMHLQISRRYDFLVMNENLCYVDYQPQGMTASIWKQYASSPRSFAQTRRLYLSFKNTPLRFRVRHSIHYVSSCILAGEFTTCVKRSPRPGLCFLCIPLGFILSRYIMWKVR